MSYVGVGRAEAPQTVRHPRVVVLQGLEIRARFITHHAHSRGRHLGPTKPRTLDIQSVYSSCSLCTWSSAM